MMMTMVMIATMVFMIAYTKTSFCFMQTEADDILV